ncbi:hypothetical protein E2C01_046351 [Portunus trituberculatus]|uniref:Uncharacterized protein n=1 Tax=Portunus trituberculatus TaxID=210409 RepID=A0A5B7FY88_PORTR|nr:hypothetical protein [Portunus trituberculatus]
MKMFSLIRTPGHALPAAPRLPARHTHTHTHRYTHADTLERLTLQHREAQFDHFLNTTSSLVPSSDKASRRGCSGSAHVCCRALRLPNCGGGGGGSGTAQHPLPPAPRRHTSRHRHALPSAQPKALPPPWDHDASGSTWGLLLGGWIRLAEHRPLNPAVYRGVAARLPHIIKGLIAARFTTLHLAAAPPRAAFVPRDPNYLLMEET